MLGELNGKAGDAAGAALNQNRLAALKLQRIGNRTDRREAGKSQRGGIDMRQRIRLLADDRRFDRDLFAIGAFAAGIEHAEHRVADFQIVHTAAESADYAGKVASGNRREFCLAAVWILAGAKFPVGSVNARGMNVDEHLAGRRRRDPAGRHISGLPDRQIVQNMQLSFGFLPPLCSKFMRRLSRSRSIPSCGKAAHWHKRP